MLSFLLGLLILPGAVPLWQAWQANRRTSLLQAVNWAAAAWTLWGAAAVTPAAPLLRYLALCVTGCAGVAVLGARRPGVGAWNFVVIGLLAVLLLPLAQSALTGAGFPLLFVSAVLAVGVLNYLPTRLGWAALLTALGCGYEIAQLSERFLTQGPRVWSVLWLGLVPWVALAGVSRSPPVSAFDRVWLDFRDRFGLVWSQRLREQFNHAALHADWPVVLRWQGLRVLPGSPVPDGEVQAALLTALRGLMKRFRAE